MGRGLKHYRVPLFENLAKYVDLTLVSDDILPIKNTTQIKLSSIKIFNVCFHFDVFKLNFGNYDKIIIIGNLNYLLLFLRGLFSGPDKVIFWGFWKTKNKLQNLIRKAVIDILKFKCIFYAPSHLISYQNASNMRRLILGRNTMHVDLEENHSISSKGDEIIFTGTLNERKKLFEFLSSTKNYWILKKSPILNIIGDGAQFLKIKKFLGNEGLDKKIILHGRVDNKEYISNIYKKAFLEFSPGQAGLSVVQALGHATPFVCLKNAISGGETENILNGYNGYQCSNWEEIIIKIDLLSQNYKKRQELQRNSLEYYKKCLKIEHLSNIFLEI